ncbi:MAG TPA: hypothetical protein DCZ04_06700 [Syntrophorhabdus aromaticivorans]|nr:hypothetical protein [Syntrophorhabdus aromaticivorans]
MGSRKKKCLNSRWRIGNKCRTGGLRIDSNDELRSMAGIFLPGADTRLKNFRQERKRFSYAGSLLLNHPNVFAKKLMIKYKKYLHLWSLMY